MRFALFGLALAAIVFIAPGGHMAFLPLFFVLPLRAGCAATAAGGAGSRGADAPRRRRR